MPKRHIFFADGEIYHIYNRSSGKIPIFNNKRNNSFFLDLIEYYRYPNNLRFSFFNALSQESQIAYLDQQIKHQPFVSIYAYALMRTHYHLIVKQNTNHGIKKLISNLQNSFAKHFNLKFNRHGSLFQGPFQAKRIETEEELLHVSRYIHLNPVTSFYIDYLDLEQYPWTSFIDYSTKGRNTFIDSSLVLNHFESFNDYKKFVYDRVDYQRTLDVVKHLTFD